MLKEVSLFLFLQSIKLLFLLLCHKRNNTFKWISKETKIYYQSEISKSESKAYLNNSLDSLVFLVFFIFIYYCHCYYYFGNLFYFISCIFYVVYINYILPTYKLCLYLKNIFRNFAIFIFYHFVLFFFIVIIFDYLLNYLIFFYYHYLLYLFFKIIFAFCCF